MGQCAMFLPVVTNRFSIEHFFGREKEAHVGASEASADQFDFSRFAG
jgi:hypothetical protein